MSSAKLETATSMYHEGKPTTEIAEILGVSRPTIYRAHGWSDCWFPSRKSMSRLIRPSTPHQRQTTR
jgi:uncharacterized protein YjcR